LIEASFFAICAAATIFLLRFLRALIAENKPATGRLERVPLSRTKARAQTTGKLAIVYANRARRTEEVKIKKAEFPSSATRDEATTSNLEPTALLQQQS
jgi:hypothetical protein